MDFSLVVFDLDHTLTTRNSSFSFYLYLWRKKKISFRKIFKAFFFYCLFKCRCFSLDFFQKKVFSSLLKGEDSSVYEFHAKKFWESRKKNFYSPIIKLLKKNEMQNKILLSSSPEFLLKPFAEKFSFPLYAGTKYKHDALKCFSSIDRFMDGESKKEFLLKVLKKQPIGKKIVVYSDSYEDLPLLQFADRPIACFPDRKLKSYAKIRGWQCLN